MKRRGFAVREVEIVDDSQLIVTSIIILDSECWI